MWEDGGLGLVLIWYRTKFTYAPGLGLLFGKTSASLYRCIQLGRMILLKAIIQDPNVMLSMPSLEDVTVFKNAISSKFLCVMILCNFLSSRLKTTTKEILTYGTSLCTSLCPSVLAYVQ